MKSSSRLIAGLALASVLFAAPAGAQESGSVQVGNATVTVGGGAAILTLPDVQSQINVTNGVFTSVLSGPFTQFDDLDDKIGWNINGSIEVPLTGGKSVAVNGFWANVDDDGSVTCTATATQACTIFNIVDDPSQQNARAFGGAGLPMTSSGKREVDFWGGARLRLGKTSPLE